MLRGVLSFRGMSNRSPTSFLDVLAQRLYRGVFRSYSLFFASLPVSLWYRNSLRLNYLTPFLSDIDISFDCGDMSDFEVSKIQSRHNFVRRPFLRVGEANFYVRRYQEFLQRYANPLEIARDPDLLQKYRFTLKRGSLFEAQKFVFAARSLNSDWKNLRHRPQWRQAKWNYHLQTLGIQESLPSLSGSSLIELLERKLFSIQSSRPYLQVMNGYLEQDSKQLESAWLKNKEASVAFFLLNPIGWISTVAQQTGFKEHLPDLLGLNPFEQQVAFSHISWEIAALLTQFTWVKNPEHYANHVQKLMQVCRFACPYFYQELWEDFAKLEPSKLVDLYSGLNAATISPTYCKQAFTNIDISSHGILRLCERHENLDAAPGLKSFTLLELIAHSDRMNLHKAMLTGQKHPHCESCYKDEELSGASPRVLSNDQGHTDTPTQALLKLGKNCELTCFKCSAANSTGWEKIFGTTESAESLAWYLEPAFWNDFEKFLPDFNKIYLAGGDALSFEGHRVFLERIIKSDHASHIELIYHTNGQRDIRPYFDLWKAFQKVHVVIVLDGVQERNDYLRPPSRWSEVQENIQILDSSPDFVDGSISFAVHGLNVFYLLQDLRWLKSQFFKKINSSLDPVSLIQPQYLQDFRSLKAIPSKLKIDVENNLRTVSYTHLTLPTKA